MVLLTVGFFSCFSSCPFVFCFSSISFCSFYTLFQCLFFFLLQFYMAFFWLSCRIGVKCVQEGHPEVICFFCFVSQEVGLNFIYALSSSVKHVYRRLFPLKIFSVQALLQSMPEFKKSEFRVALMCNTAVRMDDRANIKVKLFRLNVN